MGSALQREAEAIAWKLGLLEMPASFGEARLVGSVAFDLIVKRDIDVHLLVETQDLLAIVDPIYHALLDHPRVEEVRITDYRERGGVKIGVDAYPGQSGDWNIDLWVTNRSEATGFALVERLARELTPEHRATIMRIKEALHREGRLCDGMSTRVYIAVLDAGVRSLEEFERLERSRGGS